MLPILITYILSISLSNALPFFNSSLPNPESVVHHFHRRLSDSTRRLQSTPQSNCLTGNPIDDCWRCDPNWSNNRQRLADCGIGFGRGALGGKGGRIYVVTDSSDRDAVNPTPGTLRHAVIQDEPLWIVFASSMRIRLKQELLVNSFKTIDGRGSEVHIAGGPCITLQYVSHVIIHGVRVYDCVPGGEADVRSSPTHFGWRTKSDGDGISIYGGRDIWIDHVSLSHCADGLIDAIMGSTAITISNSYFSHHDEVMLLGHSDDYLPDTAMQVTIAFNRFGEGLVQRMPRCRLGYIHVVNNDYTEWEMYAIGGSANPTINSQGNRYTAPGDNNAKEVTKRVDTEEGDWGGWNWRTEGDVMVNGAFFVPSGEGLALRYAKAASVDPKSAGLVDQLTGFAGAWGQPRGNTLNAVSNGGGDGGGGSGTGGYLGMVFGGSGYSESTRLYVSPIHWRKVIGLDDLLNDHYEEKIRLEEKEAKKRRQKRYDSDEDDDRARDGKEALLSRFVADCQKQAKKSIAF
ncbi:putative pectate lyase 12 [Acorus gramineus]|uniref:Pectate lyase n=1 Tax=Acorus gramineus TaxID=55184 RepID=A0AAV9A9J6_ACOGR|nr:putative pectate lyase 12 [Acorus gramineus]